MGAMKYVLMEKVRVLILQLHKFSFSANSKRILKAE